MNRPATTLLAAASLAVILTACGGSPDKPTATTTALVTVSATPTTASATPTPSPSPTPTQPVRLTKKEAQKRYLDIAGKINGPINAGYDYANDGQYKKACAMEAKALTTAVREFDKVAWPAKVQSLIDERNALDTKAIAAYHACAKAKNDVRAEQDWPEYTDAGSRSSDKTSALTTSIRLLLDLPPLSN